MSEKGLQEQITGKVEKKKGQVKVGVGEVTGDRELKNEGKWEKTKGTIKEKVGKVKQKTSDRLDNEE
ncbi:MULTISPECIES: CsbD family protein [unclassified Bacillus cereus group]|uniref:CsbD family protein n=1 Tax=unclassified Bacillus cereus group TaxID=2750818 RepID=UPI001F575EEA|nr:MULTISPECIES: CsbD family protein [unclassified Bacillus cereus group]